MIKNRFHQLVSRKLAPVAFSFCLGLTALTSCEITVDEPLAALIMALDRDSVVLMLGDTIRLNMLVKPDTVTKITSFWDIIDTTGVINVLQNGAVFGTQTGEADVRVVAVNERLEDTCHVVVIEDWRELYETYPYDMLVYADVNVKGYHNDAKGLRVAAFINDELRGYGEVRTDRGVTYTLFRIWHDRPSSGQISFRYYLPYEFSTGELKFNMTFDGAVHGRLKQLIPITQ
ncbi:MAG: hypothetical protein J6W75_09900 [Bacteroidaceae bacterium]|nr:hypothetical protein [Bacteroidaceae bacterium]